MLSQVGILAPQQVDTIFMTFSGRCSRIPDDLVWIYSIYQLEIWQLHGSEDVANVLHLACVFFQDSKKSRCVRRHTVRPVPELDEKGLLGLAIVLPVSVFGIFGNFMVIVAVRRYKDLRTKHVCDIAEAYPKATAKLWNFSTILVGLGVLAIYALVMFEMWLRDLKNVRKSEGVCKLDPSMRYQRKMIRTVSVMTTAFLCTG
ncbi:unnamed protein product [Nippostrongylus brasiliensis]|uniref:Major sperm protein (inferred by orthology to a C. elegans protein) n=1 Tax=Nippostrongylus brasiliensis TaxID=27835 RepID=A0A0N4XZ41_NIPBR|nr:unnamed protein product [Nippostrongylus brasiliensis]